MKTISKTLILLFLAIVTTSCNGVAPTPTTTPMDIMETAISVAKTEMAMTQIAIPTATYPSPTIIPPDTYSDGQANPPPADKLDYAMATAQKVYTLLPYINKAKPYGEYSGCTKTYDFYNQVSYPVMLPMETVNAAFLNYFSTEKWEFTEATPGKIGSPDNGIPTIRYDVYRITSKDLPAFERLQVYLEDQSTIRGEDYIEVRAELMHVETKENLRYLIDPLPCYSNRAWWLWIRLFK